MKVFTLASELQRIHQENPHRKIAFIPTMGALHLGHLSLVEAAQQDGCYTVVSIFVNPLQFNNPEDLKKYPRTLDIDLQLLATQGVDAVFTPSIDEMYPSHVVDVTVDLGPLDSRFEGACRPGHFHGVIQVVYRLFQYVQPHVVYFGEKDLQQCLVIEQLIQQIYPQIEMCRIATKRESSGLALSSRNMRLSPTGLQTASALNRSLLAIVNGKADFCEVIKREKVELTKMGFEVEYLDCVSLPFLEELPCEYFQVNRQSSRFHCAVVVAARLEGVRLIDNQVF